MSDVDVSVLVPAYNAERTLGPCLDSLEVQDGGSFEFVLLNDGSTDGTLGLMRKRAQADPRFVVIDKPNSGYGDSLDRGLDEAHGTYVGILESDDVMYPGALGKLLSTAKASGAELVKGTYSLWWSADGRDDVQHEVPADCLGRVVCPREHDFSYLLKATDWSCLYRADFLRREGIRFLGTPGAAFQDTSFMFKVLGSADAAVFLDEPVVHYRQDNEASSINSKNKAYAICTEYDEVERWLAARPQDKDTARMRRGFQVSKLNAYLWNLDRLEGDLAEEFVQRAAREFRAYDRAGQIDWAKWDAWRATNLRAIMRDPGHYLAVRRHWRGDSAKSKALFALHLAGPRGLAQALAARRS